MWLSKLIADTCALGLFSIGTASTLLFFFFRYGETGWFGALSLIFAICDNSAEDLVSAVASERGESQPRWARVTNSVLGDICVALRLYLYNCRVTDC